jgi:hypothetical protein
MFTNRFVILLSAKRGTSGYPPVKVAITGMFGVTYIGGPTQPVPMTEARQIDNPELAWLSKPVPLRARWNAFEIDGQPLFPACEDYLKNTSEVIAKAREISDRVHGSNSLTPPPP